MQFPNFYIGPMSKNVVDSIISKKFNNKFGIIASRRQIDFNSGYCCNWKTFQFINYVRKKNSKILICRDHGGINQGLIKDDGYKSFEDDSKYFNIIHLDPFILYKDIKKASEITLNYINFLNKKNKNLYFEVGTEETIFKYEPQGLFYLLNYLKNNLTKKTFQKIIYAVIQTGTKLNLSKMKNESSFNQKRTMEFLKIVKNFGILSKEHNGDYQIDNGTFKDKLSIGIDALNFAPEFGQIETLEYLKRCSLNKTLFNKLYSQCLRSKKWVKWVNNKTRISKKEIILISCHYLLSNDIFIKNIKSKFPDIDKEIRIKIREKLQKLI